MVDISQISFRTSSEQIKRLKTYAKANKISVNAFLINLVDHALNNMEGSGYQSELTQLVAEPAKTLSSIHFKICDPWSTSTTVDLTPAEIDFLNDAARKQLRSRPLSNPVYSEILNRIGVTPNENSRDYYQEIFGFAYSFYIRDEEARKAFALEHARMSIQSLEESFIVEPLRFRVCVRGNEHNIFDNPGSYVAPVLKFVCESDQFDSVHDWDTFIAFIRLMKSVKNGQESQCYSGSYVRLTRNIDNVKTWSLSLGRLQLQITDNQLSELAEKFNTSVAENTQLSFIIRQFRLLYGEIQS
ncbi:TPA: hypothetical protein ACIVGF_002888 [Salmonella enterica subsp. enterica serovar 16:l,v:-]|nr:hypothetical protein [Salmonella enterica]